MKYSVIIPVYNAEKTIRRCVESLACAGRSDVEIILINDGSKDNSGEICQEYARKYQNVRFIEKVNGGVSSARNAGLDLADGEFIVFVDSDDYVSPDFFKVMDEALLQNEFDLWMFSYCYVSDIAKKERILTSNTYSSRATAMAAVIDAICMKTLNPPWGKIYRRSIIEKNNIRFPVGASVAEDRAFNIKYSMYIKNYAVSDSVLYYVSTENENSLTRGRQKNLKEQFAITHQYFEDALIEAPIPESEKDQYRRAVNFGDCRGIYHDAKLMIADHMGWLERQRKLGKLCDEINHKHMKYPRTRYCTLITLPVRLRLTLVIDAIAWKLTH